MFFPYPRTPLRMPADLRDELDSLQHAAQVEEIARSRHIARDVGLDAGPVPSPRHPIPTGRL